MREISHRMTLTAKHLCDTPTFASLISGRHIDKMYNARMVALVDIKACPLPYSMCRLDCPSARVKLQGGLYLFYSMNILE